MEVPRFKGFSQAEVIEAGNCSMSLLLHLYPEWLKTAKLKLNVIQFDLLANVLPNKKDLNVGKKLVTKGFRSNGQLVGKPEVDSIESMVKKNWTFRHFVEGVVVTNMIDCDLIPTFFEFITPFLRQLNKEFNKLTEKPDYTPKELPDGPSDDEKESDKDNQPEGDDEQDEGEDESGGGDNDDNGEGKGEGGGRGKPRFKTKTTAFAKALSSVFLMTDGGGLSNACTQLKLKTEDLGEMFLHFAKKGIVKKVIFHEEELKEYVEETDEAGGFEDQKLKSLAEFGVAEAKIASELRKKRKAEEILAGNGSKKKGNTPKKGSTPKK